MKLGAQWSYMSIESGSITRKASPEDQQRTQRKLEALVDPAFKGGRMLYRDVLNEWYALLELARENRLKPLHHYEEGYIESGKQDVERMRNLGETGADFHENYYPIELARIMEFSDQKQVERYNALVDELNADLERIKREKDFEKLREFIDRATNLVDEVKET